ncbi:hypothetical protein PybrP1_003729 [[Pythium] brassicae (nom. inval.)]|nr:hypothetical protein PybrP1_003729 [[Pythium] brassicae (nom. inval.)]
MFAKPTTTTSDLQEPETSEAPEAATPTKNPQAEADAGDDTPQPKPLKRAATPASVGKAGVKAKSATTPAKRTPAAKMPSSAKVPSSKKKAFDAIHAKRLAKEPTLHEHDSAKRAKADALLNSATRATRSSSREGDAAAAAKKKIAFSATRAHVSVLARPTISSSLKAAETKKAVLQRAAQPKPRAPASAKKKPQPPVGAKAKASAPTTGAKAKQPLSYKPYTGPLPKFKEDPLFSPVDKAKTLAAREAHTPKRAHTPAKKGKENSKPAAVAKATKPAPATTAPALATKAAASAGKRTPIKKAASSSAATAQAKEDRRAQFAQGVKSRAAGARQSPRRAGGAGVTAS